MTFFQYLTGDTSQQNYTREKKMFKILKGGQIRPFAYGHMIVNQRNNQKK